MKIVVCIKQVVDITMDLNLSHSDHKLVEDSLHYIENPADDSALEEALLIKDTWPDTQVISLGIGPQRVERSLRHCLAMGADQAIRIWEDSLVNMDAQVCARILAKSIASLEVDLILCGSRSLDLAEGQVPGMLAEFLALPQVSAVTKMELSPDANSAQLQRKLHRGDREIIECSLPALFALEPFMNQPRYPTVRQVLRYRDFPIEMLELSNLYSSNEELDTISSTQLISLTLPRPQPKRTPLLNTLTTDMSLLAENRLRLILSGGVSEKHGELWQGTPQDLTERLIEYLKGEGLLK